MCQEKIKFLDTIIIEDAPAEDETPDQVLHFDLDGNRIED